MDKVQFSEAQVEEKVKSGEYQFPAGKRVNVVSPDGETVSLPAEQLKDAFESGYKFEGSFDSAVREAADKHKGLSGAVNTFAAQALDEAAMGIPEMAADKLADPFTIAVKNRIKKDHDLANTIGGLAGFGASMLYGGPVGKILGVGGKAGAAAEKIVANNLAKVGVTKGSQSLAKEILANTATKAAQYGVEGAVVAAPISAAQGVLETVQSVSEDRIPDYSAAAESLLLGGGLGAAFGVVSGPTGVLFSKLKKGANKAAIAELEGAASLEGTGLKTAPNPEIGGTGRVADIAESEGVSGDLLGTLKKEVGKLKPNAEEIVNIGKEFGIDPTDGMLSGSHVVQNYESEAAKRATFGGVALGKKYRQIFGKMEDGLRNLMGVEDFGLTRAETGTKIQSSLRGKAQEAVDKLGAVFNDLRIDYNQVEMNPRALNQVAKNIHRQAKDVLSSDAEFALKKVAGKIQEGRVKNLNDLMELRTDLYSQYGSDRGKNEALKVLVKKLNDLEESTIDFSIKQRINAASVPGAATMDDALKLQQLYDEMQVAKKSWAELASSLEDTADSFSLGQVKNPRDFIRKMDELSAEQVMSKIIPKNDVNAAKKLSEKFPEYVTLASDFQKSALLEKSMIDGQFSTRRFINEYRKLQPEIRDLIFGETGVQGIKKIETILNSVPKNINPSGTASALSWGPGDITKNVFASVGEGILDYGIKRAQNVEGVLGVESRMGSVAKALDRISSWFDKGFKAASPTENAKKSISAIEQIQDNEAGENKQERFARLSRNIGEMASNPQSAMDAYSEDLSALAESGAPKTADALGAKVVNSINYLYNALPKAPTAANPFNRYQFVPTDREISAFERKLSVVADPMVALDAFEDGTITNDHVGALSANYPSIYSAIRKRVFDKLVEKPEAMKYSDRLKMSLLLGLDIDQSITPSYVKSFQDSFSIQAPQQNSGLTNQDLEGLNMKETYETPSQRMQGTRKT